VLPNNKRIRIMAVTVANEAPRVTPVHPLYDTLERGGVDMSRWRVVHALSSVTPGER